MENLNDHTASYDTAIAIIGMAGRFPGAHSVNEFWQNLIHGRIAIRTFADEELLQAGVDPTLLKLPNYVKAGSILDDIDRFDASFFQFSPREAEIMDPQHRLFLECAYQALQDAAYDPETYTGLMGVFAGSAISTYLLNNVAAKDDFLDEMGRVQVSIGNDRDSLANTISYKLNLRGPSFAVQTFCSTSLVAAHLACQSLLNYECDIALTGGVAIEVPQMKGYLYEEGGILSPDGQCRTFDEAGRGSVMGNGLGVIALKRLEEACEDGDQIYAVILGSHTNNDGNLRVSYTAPGLDGQSMVIAQAMSNAGVDAETISYIEAHGTATMLGDAVELAAMKKAFGMRTQKKQFCAIGSVKPNIGHLDRASGVTGLIKTALALQHRQIPPSLHFTQAHDDVELDKSPFYVNTQLSDWTTQDVPRRAGVSSFGLGGSNAHVVLEECPELPPSNQACPWQLLVVSAKTATALDRAMADLQTHLQQHEDSNFADVAYTLQVGRTAFNHRHFVVCHNLADAITRLTSHRQEQITYQPQRDRAIVFRSSGTWCTTHSAPLLYKLYQEEERFRQVVDDCYQTISQWSASEAQYLLSIVTNADAHEGMDANQQAIATFVFEYAMGQVWLCWGVNPAYIYGSVNGLCSALALAGILGLNDALKLCIAQSQVHHNNATSEALIDLIQHMTWHKPDIPFIAPLTGTSITEETVLDHAFWLRQLMTSSDNPIALEELPQELPPILLDLGGNLSSAKPVADNDSAIATFAEPEHIDSVRERLLTVLGQLWLAGTTIDWHKHYVGQRRLRISLPTYPFERESYWLEWRDDTSPSVAMPSGKKPDIADWFYQPVWHRSPLPPLTDQLRQCWWIFEDSQGLGADLAQRLETLGHRVLRIQSGAAFADITDTLIQLCPTEADDYHILCHRMQEQQWLPDRVVHLWNIEYTADELQPDHRQMFQATQEYGFYSLMRLVQALNTIVHDEPIELLIISSGIQSVTGEEPLTPEKATLLGACKVIPQENLHMTCRNIDFEVPTTSAKYGTDVVDNLLAECLYVNSGDTVIAYRETERWTLGYESVRLERVAPPEVPFRQHGVYLITGGLGGVGLILAEHLARTYQATLILTSRTGLPPRDQWEEWITQHQEHDETSNKLNRLLAVEQAGGYLHILQADVADVQQMRHVMTDIQTQFGGLNGILHAAGITTMSAFKATQDLTPSNCDIHFQPKVYGSYALEEAIGDLPLDFCLLFSSVSVVLGGIAFAAYVAGNAFMDVFALKHRQNASSRWVCVNWDTWFVKENPHGAIGATVADYVMLPEEGVEALTRVLAQPSPQIINSTGDLYARLQQWVVRDSAQELTTSTDSSIASVAVQAATLTSRADYERIICDVWQQVLGVSQVSLYDNFFDLGGNSLIAIQVISKLKKALHMPIPAVALFEAPTVRTLVEYLLPEIDNGRVAEPILPPSGSNAVHQESVREDIAIIGMTGRFPGASNVEAFWQNLRSGVESISFFSEEELIEVGHDPKVVRAPNFVGARPILSSEDVETFDAPFFGYSPREAEITDPQHRLFLECCWEALETAGYDPSTYQGSIGVFGGSNISTYMLGFMHDPIVGNVDEYQMVIGNDKDSLTTSVSYKFNLKGPSIAVQTFCSTSLVAVHLACQHLLNRECHMALAGGVSVRVPMKAGHLYQEGGMESPDGHCRTFDAQAHGSVFGDGAGIVVLKRVQEALADGDTILAVIKGSAINNDGSLKVSYTAPSVAGQADVVATALTRADVHPETISYIEAHGTATELGDPIEVASLTKAFQTQTNKVGYCAIGSVKTNIGHLDRAAGVTGLIKTVLALQHGELPPHLHFQAPNPEIDFAQSPFYVNTELSLWQKNGTPRRAGINSLGLGGTNAHVIVEEAPTQEPSGPSREWQLMMVSARTDAALGYQQDRLSSYLKEPSVDHLADIAHTLQVGRKIFPHRCVVLCQNEAEAVAGLTQPSDKHIQRFERIETRIDRQVAFLLPGLGELYPGISSHLYHHEAIFRQHVDLCHDFLCATYDLDVHALLHLDQGSMESNLSQQQTPDLRSLLGRGNQQTRIQKDTPLARTALAQPIVFVIEYALAQLLIQWGIRPQALLGYSLGEYVAACLAGVFSLEDALRLVVGRARLIDEMEQGAMLAVMVSEAVVQPYLDEQISLAIQNSPNTCVLAGPVSAIEQLIDRLKQDEVAYMQVETTHAFHSTMLQPLSEAVTRLACSMTLQPPRIPYLSNVTGTWITEHEATDPAYWAHHMCETVRFADGVSHLLQETDLVLLEVGPGQALSSFVRQHPDCDRSRGEQILSTLPPGGTISEQAYLLTTLGRLWLLGVPIDWTGFYSYEQRKRIPLPTYPFERQRYWLEGQPRRHTVTTPTIDTSRPEEVLSSLKKEDLGDWFYLPGWKYHPPKVPAPSQEQEGKLCWLLFGDDQGISEEIRQQLLNRQHTVITVTPGQRFIQLAETHYCVRPHIRTDYEQLIDEIQTYGSMPHQVVHCWTLNQPSSDTEHLQWVLECGFYSLMALAQALGERLEEEVCRITILSHGLYNVSGQDKLVPDNATLIGPCKVIPQEYPTLSCSIIDVPHTKAQSRQDKILLQQVLGELLSTDEDSVVALRYQGRWTPTFERLPLPEQPYDTKVLREGGTYLITGGLGGIGFALAAYLARTVHANIVLTSRTGLPRREMWDQLSSDHQNHETIRRQIDEIHQLEALGAHVLPLAADVANEKHMQEVIQRTNEQFGELHGVFHAAGVPGIGLMRHKTPDMAETVLAPKIMGTLVLERVLRGQPLDFLVLFSSITAMTGGGPGQVDYCAANAFLDTYAQATAQFRNVIAINWGEWQWNAWEEGLAGYDSDMQDFFRANRREFGISFDDGMEALQRILAHDFPQLIVSTQDFAVLAELSKSYTAASMLQRARESRQTRTKHERPAMRNEYARPQSDLESKIATIWEDVLSINGIGIHDNFFDLGGNSLVGIDLIAQLRQLLHQPSLFSYILYEAPTIAAMAQLLDDNATTNHREQRQERSSKRRESLRRRMRQPQRTDTYEESI
ncbi:MAG: beta-ketoacyl synthase N-terminal-like domain-containing protein [Chloroflexota bacterium]